MTRTAPIFRGSDAPLSNFAGSAPCQRRDNVSVEANGAQLAVTVMQHRHPLTITRNKLSAGVDIHHRQGEGGAAKGLLEVIEHVVAQVASCS